MRCPDGKRRSELLPEALGAADKAALTEKVNAYPKE